MNNPLLLVLYMGIVTWVTLVAASIVRARTWETGAKVGLGNRDNLPEPTPLSGRAARTAQNTLENFIFFAVIALVAHALGTVNPRLLVGAQIFFWARIAYIPIYYAGIIYLRTAVWVVSLIGLALMLSAII
jgi:uncharacterized MAPEG superfamily protein